MLNVISLVIGAFALLLTLIALIPLLGWANWFIIPVSMIGVVVGMLSDRNAGRNLCLIVVVIGVLRLWLGGGLL